MSPISEKSLTTGLTPKTLWGDILDAVEELGSPGDTLYLRIKKKKNPHKQIWVNKAG